MKTYSALFAKAHYQRLEERLLQNLFATRFKGQHILDIGCGQGKYLRMLQPHSASTVGTDANTAQIEALRKEGFDVYPPDKLPQKKYDVLLMSHIVEHMVPVDLIAFLDFYLPMLEDDGRLIILTPMPGIRFWHDYTHIRPYTPQSIGMMFGILAGPVAFKPKIRMELDDIQFFRDSFRIRNHRYYYPAPSIKKSGGRFSFLSLLITYINLLLASFYIASNGRIGALASWMGIYKKSNSAPIYRDAIR